MSDEPRLARHCHYDEVVAGGLLAVGLINTNVRNDCDPAYGLLYESVNKVEEVQTTTLS